MNMLRLGLFGLVLFVVHCQTLVTRRREYTLVISYAPNSSSIILINDQFPGPLLEAELNDILIVHVKNELPVNEEVSVHFHGMLVRQTPHMDGVAYITQMPIPSGQQFTHVIRAYPGGTYFYHSHSSLQAVTAFGPLLVHERWSRRNPLEIPDGPLLFSDQWQGSDRLRQEEGLLASPFRWTGEPTGLLINGQRNFLMTLEPNRKYLLRLIGATSLSTVAFAIDQHPMTIVEVDGTAVKPKSNVNSIEIGSGQRYAVTIQTKKQLQGVFLMKVAIRWRTSPVNSSCLGVLRYGSSSPVPSDLNTLAQPLLANETDLLAFAWNDLYETTLYRDTMPASAADREYVFLNTQEYAPNGRGIQWMINNATFSMASMKNMVAPLLFELYNGNEENLPNNVTYTVEENELVDIVLQNTVALNGVCESHPFHLHGHKFWIHSYGAGVYTKSTAKPSSTIYPVLRDSLMLHASDYAYFTPNRSSSNHRQPCGWVKLRMIGDNPGLWMLHCHIGAHAMMGMHAFIKEGISKLSMEYLPQH